MATLPANIEHYTFEITGLDESLRVIQYEVNAYQKRSSANCN